MSETEYINIWGDYKEIDFDRVKDICQQLHKPSLKKGYWEEERDVFEYISKSLNKSRGDKDCHVNCLFHFCNHDGVNDTQIHKCHYLYCKVLRILYDDLIVELNSPSVNINTHIIFVADGRVFSKHKEHEEEFEELREYIEKVELTSRISKLDNLDEKEVRARLFK